MGDAEFRPLQVRRYRAMTAAADSPATDDVLADEAPVAEIEASEECRSEIIVDAAPSCDEPAPAEQTRFPGDDWPSEFPDLRDDEEDRFAQIREEAIRFASIATARALRTALADDAAALTKYVDDALRACGRFGRASVRLHPADVSNYRPRSDVEVVADHTSARGEVVVETEAGRAHAVIEDCAALLARSAAHA